MNRRAVLLLALVPALARRAAAQTGAAGQFVQQIGRDFAAAIAGASTADERRARLAPFLARVVDMDGAARFCLGRFWRVASPDQQRDYLALFARALVAAVASRAETYSAGKSEITILPETPTPEGVAVRTVVRNAGQPPVSVTWLVDTASQPFKVIDVQAEGISLRQTLRSDYASFLRQNGGDIELFLRSLRAHTA